MLNLALNKRVSDNEQGINKLQPKYQGVIQKIFSQMKIENKHPNFLK